jgi:hypothetical protein
MVVSLLDILYPIAMICSTLSSGAKIPCVGLGTWESPPGEVGKFLAVFISIREICSYYSPAVP